ncbi:glycosyltransferase family 9 protein [Streptomyces spirodelae]|uniref:Glycosyltransferase family 9 protein n=1 Tax=Streptomyces spirodelae TaxID=2812904 RepID=A0ABS3WPC1_9ACTN|nr:glycosyltransferase family 9 protein [Streptomyces spirodelae]MBO8184970.1 glycosyltransferase family 9 protein [Streptomyces spirodelae]
MSPRPDAARERPRALVLRALGLGDLLTAVPALRALRRALPGHELVLAAPGWLADAVRELDAVDVLLPASAAHRGVPDRLEWPWTPPRLAVDLHGNGPQSRAVLARLTPGRLLAYADGSAPRWRADEHERARWCRLLTWYGIPADAEDLLLPRPAAASPAPGAVVLHPGADAASRRWPPERFAAVARQLRARGEEVVVTCGPGERKRAHRIAEAAGLPPSQVLGGPSGLPFSTLAALVAGARLVVVGDTGVAHLASALAAPSVVLFGPVSPAVWGPPAQPRHRPLWRPLPGDGVRPGDPHGTRPDPRLLRLSPQDVVDACAALLGEVPPPVRGAVSLVPAAPRQGAP